MINGQNAVCSAEALFQPLELSSVSVNFYCRQYGNLSKRLSSKICFNKPDEWHEWIRRFERLRQALGIPSKEEENQVNALLYTLGEQSDEMVNLRNLSENDRKMYKTVKEKFDSYF